MKLLATEKRQQNLAAVDPWTVVHFSAGLALGLTETAASHALGVAVGYELVEQYVERQRWGQEFFETPHPESWQNVVVDVAVLALGHWLGRRWNRT